MMSNSDSSNYCKSTNSSPPNEQIQYSDLVFLFGLLASFSLVDIDWLRSSHGEEGEDLKSRTGVPSEPSPYSEFETVRCHWFSMLFWLNQTLNNWRSIGESAQSPSGTPHPFHHFFF